MDEQSELAAVTANRELVRRRELAGQGVYQLA